jgi:glucose-6-phosphate 1-dehydrogenase
MLLDPVLDEWSAGGTPEQYQAGTWGPRGADEILARSGRAWRRP